MQDKIPRRGVTDLEQANLLSYGRYFLRLIPPQPRITPYPASASETHLRKFSQTR